MAARRVSRRCGRPRGNARKIPARARDRDGAGPAVARRPHPPAQAGKRSAGRLRAANKPYASSSRREPCAPLVASLARCLRLDRGLNFAHLLTQARNLPAVFSKLRGVVLAGSSDLSSQSKCSGVVFVVAAHPELISAALIAALRRQIDVIVRPVQHVHAAGIAGVSVEYRAGFILVEDTDADKFGTYCFRSSVVVVDLPARHFLRRERNIIIVIEIRTKG